MSGNWVGGSSKSKSSGPKLKTIGEFYDSGLKKSFINVHKCMWTKT